MPFIVETFACETLVQDFPQRLRKELHQAQQCLFHPSWGSMQFLLENGISLEAPETALGPERKARGSGLPKCSCFSLQSSLLHVSNVGPSWMPQD
jgi:hypothetical protein